jgi:uncharacterized protein
VNKLFKIIAIAALSISASESKSQLLTVENSNFWEVTKAGVPHSSYLFGTFHALGSTYADSLTNVMAKFELSQAFVSEIQFDSSMIFRMVKASTMKDTTLQELLTPEYYLKTDEWLKSISPYNLSVFNNFCPTALHALFINLLQTKLYGPAYPMDLYLEMKAKSAGKGTVGLETLDEQLSVLFGLSYRRQAELLMNFVDMKNLAEEQLILLNSLYRHEHLSSLEELSKELYSESEMKGMLDDRNLKWMKTIPTMIDAGSTFIAVGALHLAGPNGLVSLLRKAGYTVTPISIH